MKNEIPKYMIYDGRYNSDPDSALVCCCCETLKEAKEMRPEYGSDACIVDSKTGEIIY